MKAYQHPLQSMRVEQADPTDDLSAFESFFQRMGVPYERNFGMKRLINEEGKDILSVTQCHFHFRDGAFIGAEADEMGYFLDRLEPKDD